jgi:hypothetical protein
MSQYEVWCPSCEVSFPVGTKSCIHCGARTVADRPPKSARLSPRYASAKDQRGFSERFEHDPESSITGVVSAAEFEPLAQSSEEEEQQESPRRRGLRAGMSVIWMVLLAAGYLWQNCAGSP